jgi:hypothetical protein
MRHQAIKVRLYPTIEQEAILSQHFGCSRWWWNYAIDGSLVLNSAQIVTIKSVSYPLTLGRGIALAVGLIMRVFSPRLRNTA